VVMLYFGVAHADTLPSPEAVRKLTDDVMDKLASSSADRGFAMLKPYMPVSAAEFDSLAEKAKLQKPTIQQRFGTIVGREFIEERRIGASLIRITQLEKFERHAMLWTFIFYRGSEGWLLDTVNFNDNLQALFGQ